MNQNRASFLGLLAAAVAFAWGAALAEPARLSTDYRYASQADETLASGGGTVSDSKVLARGLRLAAPDAKGEQGRPVATAIYRFKVPLAATSFTIEAGYRADAQAKDSDIAGFLFVRNTRKPIEPENRPTPQKGEPAPAGDLYLLKGSDTTTSVTVPFESRVVDGILEVRLIAEAGQAFDAQYVQVASHRSTGDYAGLGSYRAPQPPLGRAYDPLNYGPRPPMMYGLPNLYPNLYGAGQATSQDPIFWRQLWLQQFPHSLYLYPYQYFPGRSFERHHHHKPHK